MTPKSTHFAMMATARPFEGDAPEWLHLLPKGKVETEDGREVFWDGSPLRMVSFHARSDEPRIIIDINHATALKAEAGDDVPAQGWITELSYRPDGLWGKAEWTDTGRALVAGRAYRSVSPELFFDAKGKVFGIRAVSLTNRPNFKGLVQIFSSNDKPETDDSMDKLLALLCAALSLKADAGEDAVVAAVNTLVADNRNTQGQLVKLCAAAGVPDGSAFEVQLQTVADLRNPAKTVSVKALDDLRAELMTATTKLAALETSGAKAKAEAFVDGAIAEGRLGVKPLRDHFIARHMSSAAEAANVEKEIGSFGKLSGGTVVPATPPATGEAHLTEADLHVARMMGTDTAALKKTAAAEAASQE